MKPSNVTPILILICLLAGSLSAQPLRFGLGSCGHQDHELKTLQLASEQKPDLFIFLGDNVYADTKDLSKMKESYTKLANQPSFQALKKVSKLLAVWDDHDYGWNDSGRHYELKEQSKEVFLDFWNEPTQSTRRSHKGIYHAEWIEHQGKKIQILLLDTRTYRDDLRRWPKDNPRPKQYFYSLDYEPYANADSTLLGDMQWKWLEEQFMQVADLRIICSSTQFGVEFNGYEAWANFPHEQQKMFDLIKKTKAEGVLFLSGDVHYAELSMQEHPDLYPIYDLTASGLSMDWYFATPNTYRIEGPVMTNHFGLLSIDFQNKNKEIRMEIIDVRGNSRFDYSFPLSELSFSSVREKKSEK
jgi:alkaline phosphatase D